MTNTWYNSTNDVTIGTQSEDAHGFIANTKYIQGGSDGKLVSDSGLFNGSSYTLFHVSRWVARGNQNRIWSQSNPNWLSGFHDTARGSFYQNGLLSGESWPLTNYSQNGRLDWMIVCDQPTYNGGTIRIYPELTTEKVNPVTYSGSGGNLDSMNTVGINLTENSPYQCAEAIFYDRILTAEECRKVEEYLIAKYCIM